MLDGSLWRNVPKFAIPVALTGILEQLFNAADIAVVGRFTGAQGTVNMAAVGANSPIVGLILGVVIGTALGANVVIANAMGRRDKTAVNSLGTDVIAASSAALNIEIFCYDTLNSFSQACTTFVGQNNGAGQMDRCKKTLKVCIAEDAIASAASIAVALFFGRALLGIFNTNPEVIALGYQCLCIVFAAYTFSMLYEVMSGYLRGFGISLVPAALTTLGVCGTRMIWIFAVFPHFRTFRSILVVYPLSLCITAGLIALALLHYRPARQRGRAA